MPICSCGNKKLPSACCLLKISSKPWSGVAKKVTVMVAVSQAKSCAQQGNWRVALTILKTVDEKVGFHPESTYIKALFSLHQRNLLSAIALFEKARPFFLTKVAFLINYASALSQLGRHKQAADLLSANFELINNNEKALVSTFEYAMKAQYFDFALNIANTLLQLNNSQKQYWLNAIRCAHLNIDDTGAFHLIDAALVRFPLDSDILFEKASILEIKNNLEESASIINALLACSSISASILVLAAKVNRRQGNTESAEHYLAQVNPHDIANQIQLLRSYYSELIEINKRLGNTDQVLHYAHKMHQHDTTITTQQWKEIEAQHVNMAQCSRDILLSSCGGNNSQKTNNLFIVGFPRCGSTLLEKLIVSEYEVTGHSESKVIPTLVSAIEEKTHSTWWAVSQSSLHEACAQRGPLGAAYNKHMASAVHVDKNLFNQNYLGLLKMMAPECVVVRCVRDPLCIVISCYLNNFSHVAAWQNSLNAIVHYLTVLDECWQIHEANHDERVISVKYEDVISSNGIPNPLMQLLNRTLGAGRRSNTQREEGMKTFYSRTASYAQVVQGIGASNNKSYLPFVPLLSNEVRQKIAVLQEKWGYHVSVA